MVTKWVTRSMKLIRYGDKRVEKEQVMWSLCGGIGKMIAIHCYSYPLSTHTPVISMPQ
jgi:hypothetical protein